MEFRDYEFAVKQQDKLRHKAKRYKAKYPPGWYVKYLKKLGTWNFDDVHPQNENRQGFLYVFFSCPTQHVWGNSLEECLDIAHEGGNQWPLPPAPPYPWCKQPGVCRGSCPLDPNCGE